MRARRVIRVGGALLILLGAAAAAGAGLLEREVSRPFPAALLERDRSTPARAFDRKGRLLRETIAADGTRGRFVPLEEISPLLIEATLTAEDRRFREHPGVDALAVVRAAAQNVRSLRRISGASTLTMQLVRLLRPAPRTWASKLDEALLALRLERTLGKRAILEEYMNRAPYGGNVVGAEAGALRTFGKPARDLSAAEAALLAALPQSPTRLDPLVRLEGARRRARWILDEMRRLGSITPEEHARAVAEVPSIAPSGAPDLAPEAVDWIASGSGGGEACATDPRATSRDRAPGASATLRTTLDLDLQRDIEGIVRGAAGHLADAGASEAAVVVLDVATAEVLAFAGPAARRRAPGSTLKPFAYALAIEDGRLGASSPLEDAPVHLETPGGDYAPRNYDGRFHGRVSLRQALANSLNIPAVLTLRAVGIPRMVGLVRDLGLAAVDPDPASHGLGLVLGDARVSPVGFVGAYACLARGGRFLAPRGVLEGDGRANPGGRPGPEVSLVPEALPPLLSEESCAVIADILTDDAARALTFGTGSEIALPFPVAAKTGTSVDHRDNWVAGFTARRAVAVWVGNPDGRPLRGTSGLDGAGPLFRAVWERLGGREAEGDRPDDESRAPGPRAPGVRAAGHGVPGLRAGPLPRPAGVVERRVCADTGLLASPGCARCALELFPSGRLPAGACPGGCLAPAAPLEVVTPRPGDRFYVDRGDALETRFLALRARAPEGERLRWEVDGAPLDEAPSLEPREGLREALWTVLPGRHTLVVTSQGEARRVEFEVAERR